jgi:uncharacterized membrane protein YdjX (TVP38/TMEM64 family)
MRATIWTFSACAFATAGICKGYTSTTLQAPFGRGRQGDVTILEMLPTDASIVAETILKPPLPGLDIVLSAFDLDDHPTFTVLGSYLLVTACDMVPFVPCQPLAIALGAKLGFPLAFPITTAGQTTAGVFAFTVARKATDLQLVQDSLRKLNDDDAVAKFEDFKRMTSEEEQDDRSILLGLIALRLAPFFPFSAGNYLLGGGTSVPLRLFAIATLFGCILSNLLSTSIGSGGVMLWRSQ